MQKRNRKIDLFLISVLCVIAFFFAGKTISSLKEYWALNSSSPINDCQWNVKKMDEKGYIVYAEYRFVFENKDYIGKTEFIENPFPSKRACSLAVEQLKEKSWNTFFDKNNPSKNSLQRKFPFLSIFHTMVCFGILICFLMLRELWLEKKNRNLSLFIFKSLRK